LSLQDLARGFLDESEALHALVSPLTDAELEQTTGFKSWTIGTVIQKD
jgi:hypothetical protein